MEKRNDVKVPGSKKSDMKDPDHRGQPRFTDEKRKNKEVKDSTVGGF